MKSEHNENDSSENDFKCHECQKQFANKQSLNIHISSVHERKKYECPQCKKQFTQQCNVTTHISNVHEKKVHKCTNQFKFSQITN